MKIGVAGAGIGGLAAAAALAQAGHDVTVYDQFDTPRPLGSGLVIQPVGQQVLHNIGAGQAAEALGQRIHHMLGYAEGRKRAILDVRYDLSGRDERYGLAMHRAALFDVVYHAASGSGARIEAGKAVTSLTEKHQFQFEDGQESPSFDLVIDAAGAGSPLSPLKARALPYGAIWGTVDWPTTSRLPLTQLSQRYRAARRMVGVLPSGHIPGSRDRKAAIFWSLTREELSDWRNNPISDWISKAQALWPEIAPFLEQITDHSQMTPAFYSHGTLAHPVSPGLAHIGDAAHRASPQLGQGANMALLDAWALARSLRCAPDPDTALKVFAHARRQHIRLYQSMSAIFTPLYQSESRVLPAIRDHVLTPFSRISPVPGILSRLVCGDLIAPLRGPAGKAMSGS